MKIFWYFCKVCRKPMPVRYKGTTILVDPKDNSHKECLEYILGLGMYELEGDFKPQPGWTIVDVGAHHGFYATKAAKMVKSSGKVIAIEPHPDNFRQLLTNISLNKLRNVICKNYVCSDHNGYEPLFIHTKSGFHSTAFPSEKRIDCRAIRLDTLLSQLNIDHVDLLKIDVEGAELKVLKGCLSFLSKRRISRIVAEIHSDDLLRQCTQLLRQSFSIKVFPVGSGCFLLYAKLKEQR